MSKIEGFRSEEFQKETRIGPIKMMRVRCISCEKTLFEGPVPPWTLEEYRGSLIRYVYAKYDNKCPLCRHRIIEVKRKGKETQKNESARK